jgi:hypothetical protein
MSEKLSAHQRCIRESNGGGVSAVALPEVLYGTINLNPVMFRLLKNRYDGGWVSWFCHRADCNSDHRGQIA